MNSELNHVLHRLGENIRATRSDINLSQATVARTAGISASHLSAIERGERSLSLLCLTRIAKALQTTAEKLCEGVDDEAHQQPRQSGR